MGNHSANLVLMLLLVVCYALVVSVGGYEDEGRRRESEDERRRRRSSGDVFLLQHSEHVVKTDAGEMRVVKSFRGRFQQNPMHIGFIKMEPRSLFVPQYLDSNLILFVRTGEARLGYIYKDELAEKRLEAGDVFRVPAGSAFYLVNTAERQKLRIVCSIDTTESLAWHAFQSFFIGGGTHPASVLAGFDHSTLSAAFNVPERELREILSRRQSGAIVHLSESHGPSIWTKFMDQEQHHRLAHLKRILQFEGDSREDDKETTSSWKKILVSIFGEETKNTNERTSGPDSYNLYDRQPDFKNNYGWTLALDESEYSPLGHSDTSVYLVNLSAGSMMAPHVNPVATEYGVVLRGSGTIQVVFPNGTLAMNAKVREGDVFWVPRYFPFCQTASRRGSFEFFGFTTSARNNRPQFLAGRNSLLQTMRGPELATAFGISEERLRRITDAQRESTILPSHYSDANPEWTMQAEEARMTM